MIGLPPPLAAGLDSLAASVSGRRLAAEVDALRTGYRGAGAVSGLSRQAAVAYAVYRLPATYAAVHAALSEVITAIPGFAPRSVLDLGGGSGAASWAAVELLPSLERVTVVDRDRQMLGLGRELASSGPEVLRAADRVETDVRTAAITADLVIASYCLGELEPTGALALARRPAGTVLVVEPGTPRGFGLVRDVRAAWLADGRTLAAPCPHQEPCPMRGADWCHFAARLPRTVAHRRAKGGELGHEDEKFAYVCATPLPTDAAPGRIVRHPQFRSGHVRLDLCASDGTLAGTVVARSDRAAYRAARRAGWGDRWPPAETAPPPPS